MEWMNGILEGTAFPVLTAFVLGLLTIISPCPFCSDLTAVGYIGKDVSSRPQVLRNGVFYALGKVVTYWGLSFIFILGGDIKPVQHFLEEYGERILGPFFIVCAILILIFSYVEKHHHECDCGEEHHHHHHHHHHSWIEKIVRSVPERSGVGAFIIGLVGSLAFCPYTGVLYFGVLIPLTVSSSPLWNWSLPLAFALATALPVLLITALFAYGITNISRVHARLNKMEVYLRMLCVAIFLGIGIYLTISVYSGHHHHDHHHHHPVEAVQ